MENSTVAECAYGLTVSIFNKSDENENSSSCMEKVQKVFEEMRVQVPAVSIDRAHRIGKRCPATDEKGRKIIGQDHQQMIVKFNN